MKYILGVVCISAVAILLASVNAGEDENEMLKQMAADCIAETEATDEDVNDMIGKKLPTSKNGKCLAFCMMRQFNCMTKDGIFQQIEFMDLMKMAVDNETVLAMCDKVSKQCANTKDPNDNNCETAAMILQCLDDGAKAEGYDNM